MDKKIAVIGIGNLGKRHLQSICESERQIGIFGVEPAEEQRTALIQEYAEDKRVHIYSCISELPTELEVVIIATSSNVRKKVFLELVNHAHVNNIIFEKVLFQRIDDYIEVQKILNEKKIHAWVNCARRECDAYYDLKNMLEKSERFSITVSGGDWGMGCNGVHMLDIIQYLSGSDECEIIQTNLVEGIYPSKRKGFYEVYGSIVGTCGKCDTFQIVCFKDSKLPSQIDINSDVARYSIIESKGKMLISRQEGDWETEEKEFTLPFQSQLTQKVVEKIMDTGNCNLPDYRKSMDTHIKFIEQLLCHFKKYNVEDGLCPIT